VPPGQRYRWDTPEYADAFATLVRCYEGRAHIDQVVREVATRYPAEARAVDWGAGGGDLTRLLLERFRQVYAVEPSPAQRAALAARCPAARCLEGTILSATLPTPVEVGLISHVYYHVPDHEWGAHTVRAADWLAADGTLVVILNSPDAGPNGMLEFFGAPRFDLFANLVGVMRRHKEFDFSFTRRPGRIRTASFADTLKIARFTLCDRDEGAFARAPTEEAFQRYVRAHLWDDESATGGWDQDVVVCFVRRNSLYARSP
jgi:SAM-dependent methyltransferase